MFFIGSVTGTLVLGSMSDVFGRIPMLIVANLFSVLGNLLTIYLNPNLWSLSIARFIAGLATDTNFFMMYIIGKLLMNPKNYSLSKNFLKLFFFYEKFFKILVMEYIEPRMRTFGLNLCIGLWYCIGCVLVPWVAVLTKNWHTFLLTISIPNIVIPLSCCFVPESAQWLLSVGRTDDAIACYQKIASFNRKKISNEFIEHFKVSKANFLMQFCVLILILFGFPFLSSHLTATYPRPKPQVYWVFSKLHA